jgi:hypothetical protein
VFDVVYADLQFKLDDLTEQRCIRNYTLTLTCLPRPRSADLVTVESLPIPPPDPTTVTVDDCSSTTGWSALDQDGHAVTPVVVDGVIQATENSDGFGQIGVSLVRPALVDMDGTPYLIISGESVMSNVSSTGSLSFQFDGVTIPPARMTNDDTSWTALFYRPAAFSNLVIGLTAKAASGGASVTVGVDSIVRSNSSGVTADRQQSRTLPVYGSARAQASLRIETGDASLGSQTLVFTGPPQSSGFQPPLRVYRFTGPTVTADPDAVSGATNALATSEASADQWSISTAAIQPATYELYALLSVTSSITVTLAWSAFGATGDGTPRITGSRIVTLQPGPQFVAIASLEMPTARRYVGSSGLVSLRLWASVDGVTIDDAYLFNGEGHLTVIDTTDCSLLLLNSASIDDPEATAWVGKAAGSSGGDPDVDTAVVYAGNRAQAWEQHQFAPPATNVFVVTPGTTQAQVSMTYYPRWGHHAAQVPAA